MKIALVGTAPSSNLLAPYKDPSWTIWACGPANADVLPRTDAWFELHDVAKLADHSSWMPWLSYLVIEGSKGKTIYLQKTDERFKNCAVFPKDDLIEKFSPYFFSSSLAWMAALAIDQKPEAIGFWGVDMTTTEEYGLQKPGCLHFIQVAKERGIEVVVPPESDLTKPFPLYGYCENSEMWNKLNLRKREIEGRIAGLENSIDQQRYELAQREGEKQTLWYVMNTWV